MNERTNERTNEGMHACVKLNGSQSAQRNASKSAGPSVFSSFSSVLLALTTPAYIVRGALFLLLVTRSFMYRRGGGTWS